MQRDKRGRFVKKADLGTSLSLNSPSGGGVSSSLNFGSTKKIRYNYKDGLIVDENGNVLTALEVSDTTKYQRDYTLQPNPNFLGNTLNIPSINNTPAENVNESAEDPSAGINLKDPNKKSLGNVLTTALTSSIDKTKLADYLEYARAGIGASINNKIAERALEAEKPFLQDVSESHRSVYGDYRSKIEGEKAAAKLRNMASKPLTSDGAL